MQVIFYKTSDDRRVVSKNLQLVMQTDIIVKDKTTVTEPILWLVYDKNVVTSNYVYIPDWDRYYYCKFEVGEDNSMLVYCEVDVLMSFRPYILNLYCVIERQEFNYNPYIFDGELLTRCDKTIITQNIGQVGIDNTIRYYLTTTGGVSESEV